MSQLPTISMTQRGAISLVYTSYGLESRMVHPKPLFQKETRIAQSCELFSRFIAQGFIKLGTPEPIISKRPAALSKLAVERSNLFIGAALTGLGVAVYNPILAFSGVGLFLLIVLDTWLRR